MDVNSTASMTEDRHGLLASDSAMLWHFGSGFEAQERKERRLVLSDPSPFSHPIPSCVVVGELWSVLLLVCLQASLLLLVISTLVKVKGKLTTHR